MRRLAPFLLLLAACESIWSGTEQNYRDFLGANPPGDLTVTFFEVTHGDSFLIEFPRGGTLLVDAGDGRSVDPILNYLSARGIEGIEVALLTHPHLDHYAGMVQVLERHPFGQFISNGQADTLAPWKRLESALERGGVPRRTVKRGDTIDAFDDVRIDVLYPDADALARAAGGDANRGSIVLRLTYGETVLLLAGDAAGEEERRLIALEGEALKSDVLKVGHHGAPGSTSDAWVASVQPAIAVSQGSGQSSLPPYARRQELNLQGRLKKAGSRLYDTGRDGAVQIVSDGKTVRATSFRETFTSP